MKNKKIYCFLFFTVLVLLCSTSCGKPVDEQEKQRQRQLNERAKEQKKIKSKVNITLRAAHVAYNVERYALAVEKYRIAVNEGWSDGIDLYKYADSLEREGQTEESKVYYRRAHTELRDFYPNHTLIHTLEQKGYN